MSLMKIVILILIASCLMMYTEYVHEIQPCSANFFHMKILLLRNWFCQAKSNKSCITLHKMSRKMKGSLQNVKQNEKNVAAVLL